MFSVSFCNNCLTLSYIFLYYLPKFQKGNCMWTRFWGNDEIVPKIPIGWLWLRDRVTNLKSHSANITKAMITKRGGNTYQNKTLLFLDVMSYDHVITWHVTTKLGGNAYQNEKVPLIHFTWRHHAKVIKVRVPKFALMEGTYSHRTRDLWLCDVLTNEKRQITTFIKALRHYIWKIKKGSKTYLFSGFKD